jgi:hypothetical protein
VLLIIYDTFERVNYITKFAGDAGILMISAYGLSNVIFTIIFLTPYRRLTWDLVRLGPLWQLLCPTIRRLLLMLLETESKSRHHRIFEGE